MLRDIHALYRFEAPGTNIPEVVVLRGEQPPVRSGGLGKWEVIDRPKRKGMTRYVGQDPVRLDLSILFDGWKQDNSVEDDIASLLRMQQEVSGEPPKITVNEDSRLGVPITNYAGQWVIESIDWGQNQIWVDGERQRQDGTVHLLEYIKVDTLTFGPGASGSGNRGTGAKHATHVVKTGETLTTIAVKEYGDRSKWKLIAKRNGITDPRHVKAGRTLVLP